MLAAEAGASTLSVPDILLDLLIILVAAKVGAELSERIGVPAVVGEIIAGIAIGPSALDLVGETDVLHFLAELGVILLLLEVGMEMDLRELAAVGRSSLQVAFAGVALPFAAGAAVMLAFGKSGNTALFVGAALTATSVGITARVFGDLRALATSEARTVLGAAVADDVLGLVILTVVVRVVSEGSVGFGTVANIVGIAVLFLIGAGAAGILLAPVLFSSAQRIARGSGTVFVLALAFTLGIAVLANEAKLAPIVGAFVAGLAISRAAQADRVRRDITPVVHLLVPVFFVRIGIDSEISQFTKPSVLGLAACLLVVGVVGKVVAGWMATTSAGDHLLIGLGMIPRGEVGLIFAGIGLAEGVLSQDLYAALLVVVLATTLITPPVLKLRYTSLAKQRPLHAADATPPEGGWLQRQDGFVELVGSPPDDLGLVIALGAARLVEDARPGRRVADWLTKLPDTAFQWDNEATARLFELLRDGGPRAWRLLHTTGVLERALPELADAIEARRSDPAVHDPTRVLQWELVEAVHAQLDELAERVRRHIQHPEWVVLAALVLEVTAGDAESARGVARQLTRRLALSTDADEEVALLVGDSGLLLGASRRVDAFTEGPIEQLAIRLRHRERAAALYVLTLAYFELDHLERQRLDQVWELLDAVLGELEAGQPELGDILQHRRDRALAIVRDNLLARRRINTGPLVWLLSGPPAALARQALSIYPVPEHDDVRVSVVPAEATVDVVCRDRTGLLAAVSAGLEAAGLDITSAIVATWPDGMALSSFRVKDHARIPVDHIRSLILENLHETQPAAPIDKVDARADNDASPWYTILTVESDDRPGLLHAITAAIASTRTYIHSARVATRPDGRALDSFELSDEHGAKLTPRTVDDIIAAMRSGTALATTGRRRMFGRAASRSTISRNR
ncbi:MAG TPA: cation:proton antiporter [Acidimicrobiales bacterium]|nr:cation:proton antiporter [Acidimicrobiales bacterium]